MQPTNANDPFGFNGLDDIFKAMSQGMDQNPQQPQTPPTQSGQNGGGGNNRRGNGNSVLGQFGVNLTQKAKNGEIDPVIGRDGEIARVIEILNRRTKNNPVLIGEAGVGKTAVVESLALKIANGDVPTKLQDRQVIQLDVVSLVQGTGIRGQFEQRMQQLLDELKKSDNTILFIDEIHEIVGAGNAEGGMDAGNVLKPALARGELQLVGATTNNEYRQIEKDAALARRLQPVTVDEPSVEETEEILKGIQKRYEDFHHVKYTDEAIKAAVSLSNRYIQDRYLPDKAIDLLDESGSKKNLTIKVVDPNALKKKIADAENQKQGALKQEDYEKAAFYRDQVNKLEKKCKKTKLVCLMKIPQLSLKKTWNKSSNKRRIFQSANSSNKNSNNSKPWRLILKPMSSAKTTPWTKWRAPFAATASVSTKLVGQSAVSYSSALPALGKRSLLSN